MPTIKSMIKRTLVILLLFSLFSLYGKPRYSPNLKEKTAEEEEQNDPSQIFLVGTSKGLYAVDEKNRASLLWSGGKVEQIIYVSGEQNLWYFRTSCGIFCSKDLKNFEERNGSLPFLRIKTYENETLSYERRVHPLKDLAVNPLNAEELVTATKDGVYLTQDGGKNWKGIGSVSKKTSGIKAVAIGEFGGEKAAFMSHSIYGFAYILLEKDGEWKNARGGFYTSPTFNNVDELSDIYVKKEKNGECAVYAANSYSPRVYRFDWQTKRASLLYSGERKVDFIDSITSVKDVLVATRLGGLLSIDLKKGNSLLKAAKFDEWKKAFNGAPGNVLCAFIPSSRTTFGESLVLNELWALEANALYTPYAKEADGKKSVYASAYQCRTQGGIDKFIKIVKQNSLNSLVIDMKDDYGLLRYKSNDEKVLSLAKSSAYALDLEHFVDECKKEGIYLIARIVVFKDRHLAKQQDGCLAVWDKTANKAWRGIKRYESFEDADGKKRKRAIHYDEFWVDPYCPTVWKYNVDIAKELIRRGFDEIQFDYIRFPTDGINLSKAFYRYKSEGMDKEAALMSFLNYARKNIDSPIGVDIYGANGWYRSGTRTGQDVEMLSNFVDVICPMFYPSHFENAFLNYKPYALRPKRIYYYGTFRNTIIGRNRVIVRPWVQAFFLNVAYDRQFYDKSYVKGEVKGVNESVKRGYMYWNNSGNYEMISRDEEENTESALKKIEKESSY